MLSIIIPVYNVENYILDCLSSVKAQSYDDYEVICVDDCGNDSSMKLIEKFISENSDMNIKIVRHDSNKGLSQARNTGIKNANGEFVMFLDSDDMLVDQSLEGITHIMERDHLDVLDCGIIEIYDQKDINLDLAIKTMPDTNIITGKEFYVEMIKNKNYIPVVWNKIYDSSFLKKFSFTPGLISEDEDFTIRILISAKRFRHLSKDLYIYRRRDGSIMTLFNRNLEWVKSYVYIIGVFRKLISSENQTIVKKCLATRANQIATSLIKNCVQYNVSKEIENKVIELVKDNELYLIGRKSYGLIEVLQSYLLRFPKIFRLIYSKLLAIKSGGENYD